uniref:Uncharacterized protein n=1 Tax=Caenorhabditis japonica TaxID=281687 RepID=A0A8R1E7H5_CAEJA
MERICSARTENTNNLRSVETLSLSNRFNLEQSIRSIRALKLLINCNTLVFALLSAVTTTIHFNSARLTKAHYLALVEAVHILPLYGIAVSLGVYSRLQSFNNNQTKQLKMAIQTKSDVYFDQFRRQMQ